MQAQSDPRCNNGNLHLVEEKDEHRESGSGFQLQDGIDFDLSKCALLGPQEKAARKLEQRLNMNQRPVIGMGVIKYFADNNAFRIKKMSLLPAPKSFCSDTSGTNGMQVSFYSRVAEVNEQGELSGDETTQSGTSNSSDEEELALGGVEQCQ